MQQRSFVSAHSPLFPLPLSFDRAEVPLANLVFREDIRHSKGGVGMGVVIPSG
jgi:hypothetical protein